MSTLSNNLIKLRHANHLTQQQVSDGIGSPIKTYQAYEYGRSEPSLEKVIAIARFYNITVEELVDNPISKANSFEMKFATAPPHIKNAVISLLRL